MRKANPGTFLSSKFRSRSENSRQQLYQELSRRIPRHALLPTLDVIDKWLEEGEVERRDSDAFDNPLVSVKKRNKWRACIDSSPCQRKKILDEQNAIPLLEDALEGPTKFRFFALFENPEGLHADAAGGTRSRSDKILRSRQWSSSLCRNPPMDSKERPLISREESRRLLGQTFSFGTYGSTLMIS